MPTVEERLGSLEDRLAIYELIASYGPAVDSVSQASVAALWAPEGSYRIADLPPMVGREQVAGLVLGEAHQDYVRRGCAHVMSLPHVEVVGRKAVAIGYSTIFVHGEEGWVAERVGANRWELEKTDGRWQVTERRNSLLDGSEHSRVLLRGDGDQAGDEVG